MNIISVKKKRVSEINIICLKKKIPKSMLFLLIKRYSGIKHHLSLKRRRNNYSQTNVVSVAG